VTFKIEHLFHVIHMSDDFEKLHHWYHDVFDVRSGWHGSDHYSPLEKRYADLVTFADAVVEPMAPATDREGWEQAPVGRFYTRFGKRWHSIAWFVSDIFALYDSLKESGIRFFGGGGLSLAQRPTQSTVLYTHPKDTMGALEFLERKLLEGRPSGDDPRFKPGYDPSWWANNHPLGLERLGWITTIVSDVPKAKKVFVDTLGGRQIHESESKLTDTHGTFVAVGDHTVVEIATPLSADSLAGIDQVKNGDILHAVTWKVVDLHRAEEHLRSKGIKTLAKDEVMLLADPNDTFGAVMRFTTRGIPGDPRARNGGLG
jgi:hypothetical protein